MLRIVPCLFLVCPSLCLGPALAHREDLNEVGVAEPLGVLQQPLALPTLIAQALAHSSLCFLQLASLCVELADGALRAIRRTSGSAGEAGEGGHQTPRWCATTPMARHTWPVRVAAIPLQQQ